MKKPRCSLSGCWSRAENHYGVRLTVACERGKPLRSVHPKLAILAIVGVHCRPSATPTMDSRLCGNDEVGYGNDEVGHGNDEVGQRSIPGRYPLGR